MIKGMSIAGRRFGREDWLDSAERALDFIRARLWQDGRLLATYKDGRAHLAAYLDDHAFLIDALLEFAQARFRPEDLDLARRLAEVALAHFQDQENGGFFFTADDHEALILRPKPVSDDATPAGNGIAAYALNRLGHLLGEPRYLEAAERTLTGAWSAIAQVPYAHGAALVALEEQLYPTQTVILRGEPDAMRAWSQRCWQHYAPSRMTLSVPSDLQDLPGIMAERKPLGPVTAYVCTGHTCQAPITRFEDLKRIGNSTASSVGEA